MDGAAPTSHRGTVSGGVSISIAMLCMAFYGSVIVHPPVNNLEAIFEFGGGLVMAVIPGLILTGVFLQDTPKGARGYLWLGLALWALLAAICLVGLVWGNSLPAAGL